MNKAIKTLKNQLKYAKKAKSFAWAKYYGQVAEANTTAVKHHQKLAALLEAGAEGGIPEHVKTELKDMIDELRKTCECPICLEVINTEDMEITNCGHKFHKNCLAQIETNKCPTCRKKLKWNED